MATKDWKKEQLEGKRRILFRNVKTKDSVMIAYSSRGIAETPYFVGIAERGFLKETKNFKTKSKALAYARSYMRKH